MSDFSRGAVVVRQGGAVTIRQGDPQIGGAIQRALEPPRDKKPTGKPLTPEQVEVVRAELDRQHIQRSLLRVAVGNSRTPEEYTDLVIKARGDYGEFSRPPGPLRRVGRRLISIYGLLVYLVHAAHRAQDHLLKP